MDGPTRPRGRLLGVLPTFHRPEELALTLTRIGEGSRVPDRVVVVDNGADQRTEAVVREASSRFPGLEYLRAPENLGYAGGVGLGMEHLLPEALDDDWVVVFDDDDPPFEPETVGALERFGERMRRRDPRTAAVGSHGGRYDWRRGRIRRVPDEELHGAVAIDYVGGNSIPFVLVRAIREVGPFSRDIFFGLSEVEFCLRLRRAGWTAYADGDLWARSRAGHGRLGRSGRPSARVPQPDWRRYYTLRNDLYILRQHGRRRAAVRVTLVHGLGKPLANLPVSPRRALRNLVLNWRACRDGWTGRMGRTMEPHPWGRRDTKPALT